MGLQCCIAASQPSIWNTNTNVEKRKERKLPHLRRKSEIRFTRATLTSQRSFAVRNVNVISGFQFCYFISFFLSQPGKVGGYYVDQGRPCCSYTHTHICGTRAAAQCTTVESIRNNNQQHTAEIFGFKMFPVEPLRVKSSKPFFAYDLHLARWYIAWWYNLTIFSSFPIFLTNSNFRHFFQIAFLKKPPRENWRFEIKTTTKKGFPVNRFSVIWNWSAASMETDVELKVGRCWSHSSAGSTDHFGLHAHT